MATFKADSFLVKTKTSFEYFYHQSSILHSRNLLGGLSILILIVEILLFLNISKMSSWFDFSDVEKLWTVYGTTQKSVPCPSPLYEELSEKTYCAMRLKSLIAEESSNFILVSMIFGMVVSFNICRLRNRYWRTAGKRPKTHDQSRF